MKIVLATCLLLLAFATNAQDSTKVDTVATVLAITSHKVSSLQSVPGYKLVRNGCVVGYLSRQRKQLPRRVQVWGSL